jgi:hypothetical protein
MVSSSSRASTRSSPVLSVPSIGRALHLTIRVDGKSCYDPHVDGRCNCLPHERPSTLIMGHNVAMPTTLVLVWQQVILSLHVLRDRTAQICAGTTLAMTLLAIGSAPNADPGPWGWLGLLLVGALTLIAIVILVASRSLTISQADRQHRITAAVTFGIVALAVNLTFGLWSTILLALAMLLLARQATAIRPGTFPWLLCATLVTLIPFWVWAALDAWDPGLLMLIPLAALAYLSGGHMRDAYDELPPEGRVLSSRGHRLGAWMGMLLGGLLIVIAGLIGTSSYAWISLGGISAAIFIALEAGIPRPEDQPGRYSTALCDGAFVFTAVCWLISIT